MRRLIIAALFAAVATPAWAQQKMEKPGITNFTKVDAVVACGGATQTAALEGLKNDGFKSVINLRQASENGATIDENRAKATELGLKYIHIPLNAAAPENKTVDDFLAAVNDKSNQPVYIQCGSANRVTAGSARMSKIKTVRETYPVFGSQNSPKTRRPRRRA